MMSAAPGPPSRNYCSVQYVHSHPVENVESSANSLEALTSAEVQSSYSSGAALCKMASRRVPSNSCGQSDKPTSFRKNVQVELRHLRRTKSERLDGTVWASFLPERAQAGGEQCQSAGGRFELQWAGAERVNDELATPTALRV